MLSKYLLLEKYFNETMDRNSSKNDCFNNYDYCHPLIAAQKIIGHAKIKKILPISEAVYFNNLVREGKTIKEISKITGKASSYIRYRIKLLKLPESIYFLINTGLLSETKIKFLMDIEEIFQETQWPTNEIYSDMGIDAESWAGLFQILISWEYYWVSNQDFENIINRLKYHMLQLTWSAINGNRILTDNTTVGQLRKLMNIKVRSLTDEEILWIFKFSKNTY
jgi:hypothetical protein